MSETADRQPDNPTVRQLAAQQGRQESSNYTAGLNRTLQCFLFFLCERTLHFTPF